MAVLWWQITSTTLLDYHKLLELSVEIQQLSLFSNGSSMRRVVVDKLFLAARAIIVLRWKSTLQMPCHEYFPNRHRKWAFITSFVKNPTSV